MSDNGEKPHKIDPHFMEFPETVQFTGVVETSLKVVHITSLAIIVAGILIAIRDYPAGLILLMAFLAIVLGFEYWMMKKSLKKLRITLLLREDPVQALQGSYHVGAIVTGAIDNHMDNPNELGFRPAPNRRLLIWAFDSKADAEITAKRLLEYLPCDNPQQ
jgi:hypothetical protein